MKRVLIVEDCEELVEVWCRVLGDFGVECLTAPSLSKALRLFTENYPLPGIDAIVWDGQVRGGDSPDGTIQKVVAAGFSGPMLACSGDPHLQRKQMAVGCTHEIDKDKVVSNLVKLLRLVKK